MTHNQNSINSDAYIKIVDLKHSIKSDAKIIVKWDGIAKPQVIYVRGSPILPKGIVVTKPKFPKAAICSQKPKPNAIIKVAEKPTTIGTSEKDKAKVTRARFVGTI